MPCFIRRLLIFLALPCSMMGATPFSEGVKLLESIYVVVEESASEPRSIGSYSVRLYALKNPGWPTDNFVHGIVRSRDGSIQSIESADIDQDGFEDVVVLIRSAGSGGCLQAEAFRCAEGKVDVIASVLGLDPKAKYVERLKLLVD
ncbi:PliI family lysozyme inhibitor of I-type lysozyme [Opitutaceae bacterium]|nr:PliI family lysozyme inhibitor of I-type lysozyme [Opitutaceae bacterium]